MSFQFSKFLKTSWRKKASLLESANHSFHTTYLQVDATRDVLGKSNHFLLVATTFGNHTLHHLFPTVDHSKLPFLYPIFEETCRQFGVRYEPRSTLNLLVGTHQQMARNCPSICSLENGRLKTKKTK